MTTSNDAYQEGFKAKQQGQQTRDCPYDGRKREGKDWMRGWRMAEPPEDNSNDESYKIAARPVKRIE